MKPSSKVCLSVLLVACVLACVKQPPAGTPTGAAQVKPSTGKVEGIVRDTQNQPIIGATVKFTSSALPGMKGTATDTKGRFSVSDLPAGNDYKVKVEAPGYNPVVQNRITVQAGTKIVLPFTLTGGASEITVTAMPAVQGGVTGGVAGGVLGGVIGGARQASGSSALYLAPSVVPSGMVSPGIASKSTSVGTQLLVIERKSGFAPEPSSAGAGDERPTQGTLRAQTPKGEPLGDFPLKHTKVEAYVGGYLARTVVTQHYTNPYKQVIEAVYVFPLGSMAAVHDFVMQVGDRKIVGIVRPREEAERIYREARARGQTASLLTQERPNIFTQNVANIEPGGSVDITITTFERLPYEQGTYEYVFPMVVGPRYIPGSPKKAAPPQTTTGGGGWSPPTTAVPDAHKITPPVLKPGERSGHDIDVTVHLDAGLPLKSVECVTHKVSIRKLSRTQRLVRLSPADTIPNRDFVLRWTVDASKMRFGVLAYRKKKDGYFTLMVQPPLKPSDSQVSPREITFVLDVSGSMSGLPIETSKSLVRKVLDSMRPGDLFNVFTFASGNSQLWESPRPYTPANVIAAKKFLNDLRGAGGTEMMAGLGRAVTAKHDPKYLQMYVFCTDGFVGNDQEILSFIKQARGNARFFAFGIGNSVNRYLIEGIGREGEGKSMVVMPRDSGSADRAAAAFYRCIDSPVLVAPSIDWNGLPVKDVYPAHPGDLFAGGTLDVVARYTKPASGKIYVTGRVGAKKVRFPVRVTLPARATSHSELAPVWARCKIADLSSDMLDAGDKERDGLVKKITDLAVKYKLASRYTSFVAVDASRIVGDGRPLKVVQPVELPEGVSYQGVFGERGVGEVEAVPAWGVRLQDTESGKVRVCTVDAGGPAEKAGVKPGAELKAVNGTAVNDLVHLEGLLLQNPARTVTVTFAPGGKTALPAP